MNISKASVAGSIVLGMVLTIALAASPGNNGDSLVSGFSQMYNLNFAAAHKTFESWQLEHPNDPLGAAATGAQRHRNR